MTFFLVCRNDSSVEGKIFVRLTSADCVHSVTSVSLSLNQPQLVFKMKRIVGLFLIAICLASIFSGALAQKIYQEPITDIATKLKNLKISCETSCTRSVKMKTATAVLFLCGVIISSTSAASTRKQQNLPPWVDCTSNSDCGVGYCCMINHERYSYPRCERLREVGDVCRPGGPLITNGSRYYPDHTEIYLENVYLQLCPCGSGLVCQRSDPYCRPSEPVESNDVQILKDDATSTIDNQIIRD